jgi:isoleucyl-tRNA synthetase
MSKPKFEKADPIVNFPEVERKIGDFWREHDIFKKSLELRRGATPFVFYEGPPTANGVPHNGHVLTRVAKDVFLRYRTMRGYDVPRKAGWDTHGLPVEVEVEKELGIHGKAEIESYGVEEFISRCIDSVFRYTIEWERMTERIGFWVDLSDAYVTYHRTYVESVWWALSELFRKDLLYRGHKVVWWWAQGGTALSSAEVGLGYKTVDDSSVYVEFPLVDEPDTSLLIWTTTPWTLASNMYAAVKPDVDYVVVKHGKRKQKLILAAALRETIEGKVGEKLPVERELKGQELLGRRYKPPFDDYYQLYGDREVELAEGGTEPMLWKVLAADFVELDQGTGLVHEAPAFGEVDHDLHREILGRYKRPEEVPLLCAVRPDGTFSDEIPSLAGKWVKDADPEIVRYLKDRGILLHRENYRHEYPFCWRADEDPLIQYARPAWFIRTTAMIQDAIRNNRAVDWLPEHIKEGRFGDFLANNVDWALSRERYWGTPLNIWVNDETGEMVAPSSVDEILKKNPGAFEAFEKARQSNPSLSEHLIVHKPWIDYVTWTDKGKPGVFRRVPEVIDAWFDSGSMPFAQWGFPHRGKEVFIPTFPADFITEALDQTRGWFYSLLMISTLVFDGETMGRMGMKAVKYPHPYRTCIVLGHVTDPTGKKESKSKGNYTPPDVILDRVAMEFAVVSADDAGMKPKPGTALVAREDLQGLDLKPGALVKVYPVDKTSPALELQIDTAKRLPRRLVLLVDEDRKRLGVNPTARGLKLLPADVPRLSEKERVVLEDTATPAPGADAFRWFFLGSNPPWNPTRHSLANVRSLQKEFPLKLRNVYSFFTIYAAIDEFDPVKMKGRPIQERTRLDRWILSELSILTERVVERMDAFRAYEAARELSSFVDGLSNWYLRRSRQRFWKSEVDDDKVDAYATLYESLVTLIKLAAPFVPYMTEDAYQNLVKGPWGDEAADSVHLVDYPQADASRVDLSLSEEMAVVRDIVSLGLRVRTDHRLKVRQPLSRAEVILSHPDLEERLEQYRELILEELNVVEVDFVKGAEEHILYGIKPNFRRLGPKLGKKMPILKSTLAKADGASLRQDLLETGKAEIDVDGEVVVLELDDVEVVVEAKEGYAAAGDQTAVVVLSTELTPELVEEGVYRELLNRIQTFRKELELEYTQRIRLAIEGSEHLAGIVKARQEHLMRETLCVELAANGDSWKDVSRREIEIEGEVAKLSLARA